MHRLLPLLGLVLCAPSDGRAQASATVQRTLTETEWSAPRSRALFHSLDGNGDDRLDLLEAAGLKTLAGVRDLDSFRRLDRNRDGHLDLAEFDAHFRDLIAHDQALRLVPARPDLLVEERAPEPASPAERLLALFDQDADGALAREELVGLIQQLRVPDQLVRHFDRLDRDRSGTVSTAEFQPFLELLPARVIPSAPAPVEASTLPNGFGPYDLDGDGRIGRAELARFLWRLDPTLQRWEAAILRRADTDGDGALNADEIARSIRKAQPEKTGRRQTN